MSESRQAVEAVFHIELPKLIAALMRLVGDLGLAEELAQDAMVAALEHWPADGIPERPGAWLMATARNRALDQLRRARWVAFDSDALERLDQHEAGRHEPDFAPELDMAMDDPIGDDLLRLMFTACHPVLTPEARVTLTLRVVGGLSVAEIARSYLSTEATIAQRLVRAKRALAIAKPEFELPPPDQLAERLEPVLEVLYLIFNEGYAATSGSDWMRPDLCHEALRMGRILAELAPAHAEVHGLIALMELQASRLAARVDAQGEPVLLADQDRRQWDRLLIGRGLAALERCHRLSGAIGPYQLQARIAACHAVAATFGDTDWAQIAELYGWLRQCQNSPVVELNRAVAVGMAQGAEAALALLAPLFEHPQMARYHLLHAVHGELLSRAGEDQAARAAFARAAELAGNERERALMQRRAGTPRT